MQVTHKIDVHLDKNRLIAPVDVMQGDAYTRKLEISLYFAGEEWLVPEGASIVIGYFGASGRGAYDSFPDGAPIYQTDGNKVMIALIPQVTAAFGITYVTVVFMCEDGEQLATFAVPVKAARNPALGAGKPQDYYNLREWASTPLYVELIQASDGDWMADEQYDRILADYKAGRQILCRLELDQQWLKLPMVKEAAGLFTFGAIIGGQEWQAIISPGEDGAAAVAVTATPLAMQTDLRPAATDEIYFDITDDGVISLKPEYRGACSSNSYPYGLSDNGKGRNGTRNKELPQEIVIPAEVGGVAVSALAVAMFMHNRRVKKLWLPAGVAEIPQNCCAEANALEEISGTENVHTLGKNAFYRTGIRKAYFPSLATIVEGSNFMGCANLVIADLGHVLMQDNATIPKRCFSGCEKLEYLRHADGVTCIREEGLYATSRLRELAFLPNLTAVEKYGLLLSRADYAWEELADCTFGELSTSNDINTTDYSGCNFTPCNTPMRSTFEQHNPLWADKQIGNCQRTYSDGCAVVSAAMIYSALMDVDMDSPEVFVAAVGAVDESLLDLDIANGELDNSGGADHSWTELAQWFDAVGCSTEYVPSVSAENVQAVYDALAGGALVFARVCAGMDDGNHVAVIHGVNGYGEFLVTDPSSAGRQIGVYEAANYPMSVQNFMRDNGGDHFMIVRKK